MAQEQITGFEERDLPVLNEELNRIDKEINLVVPIGIMMIWTTDTAPDNWLLCYGQAVSRTFYVGLFNIIGTDFGTGDGSTTFNIPDMRGRFPLGQDDMGGTSANRVVLASADTVGLAGGNELKNLGHTHGSGSFDITGTSDGANGSTFTPSAGGSTSYVNPSHTHDLTAIAVAGTSASGLSAIQDVLNPFLTINYIIKI